MNKFKTMGIAVVMALALTAFVGAGSAAASYFKAPGAGAGESTTWSGSLSGKSHVLTLGGDKFTCSKVSFSGTMLGSSTTEVTVTPELAGCAWNFVPGSEVSWARNGCKFKLRPGLGSGSSTTGWLDLVGCESAMSISYGGCQITIGNQNGLGTAKYTTTGAGKETVQVVANLQNIEYTRSGSCAWANGTFSDGTHSGEWSVKGLRSAVQVPISVEATSPSLFGANEAPASISGTNAGQLKAFNFGANGFLWCGTQGHSGTLSTTTATSLTVAPSYSSCTWYSPFALTEVPVSDKDVSAGACSYKLQAAGGLEVIGASCAGSPITIAMPGCVIAIGPQSTATSSSFLANEGSGKLRSVKMQLGADSALTYTATGASCLKSGTWSDGYFASKATFTATNGGGKQQGLWVQ